jgi:superfamily II DNA/RNA helicase
MSFKELGLSESVLRAVSEAGYEQPTPIQKQAIPQVLMGRDVLGCAQTGTGKTASFTLPMIDILGQGRAKARMPRSLILEPTRELAAQVDENFETYGKYTKLNTALLIGGVSFADQDRKLDRGVDVLIATPGRLLDHVERGKVLMNDVSFLVIDEADRMLDMGFIPDVERILSFITKKHQTLLFSATMPREIRRLADRFLTDPKEITVAALSSAAETVEQALAVVQTRDKRAALRSLLRTQQVKNALIFCNRKRDVGILHRSLVRHGFNAGALHGDMDQFQRMDTLDKFKTDEIRLLVCSDVAARGLDIAGVSHVFNFDVPTHAEDYVHRIGRTGRAGRTGHAFTLATPEDSKYVAAIEKLAGRDIPRVDIEEVAGAELKEETGKSRRRGKAPERSGAKKSKSGERQAEQAQDRPKQAKENRREPRREKEKVGEVPDYGDVPFGETDQVPAFLKRSAAL